MLRLKIFSIGKTKEEWLNQAIQEYEKRLTGRLTLEWIWAKDNQHLMQCIDKEPLVLCLDPEGTLYTSEEFARFFDKTITSGGSRLALVIGGSDGIPQSLKKSGLLISLSRLTFTHQITRLILVEQIYRALEILRGSNYQK